MSTVTTGTTGADAGGAAAGPTDRVSLRDAHAALAASAVGSSGGGGEGSARSVCKRAVRVLGERFGAPLVMLVYTGDAQTVEESAGESAAREKYGSLLDAPLRAAPRCGGGRGSAGSAWRR